MTNKIKMLVLSLTGKCNFACRYCYAVDHNSSKMNIATALAAVKLAEVSGEKFILQFSGGEPLLNFRTLQAVVDYCKTRKLPVVLQLQTNGSLLNDAMAQYLFQNKVAIGLSLDGRPAVNDRLRLKKNGSGTTGAILKGIEVLRRNNIACGLTCVVTKENVRQLSEIIDFAYFLGNIRRIGFDILRNQGRGKTLCLPSAEEMREAMEAVYNRRDKLSNMTGYSIRISQEERVKSLYTDTDNCFRHCYAMNGEAAFVDALGDIYACSSLVGCKEFYLGNVFTGLLPSLLTRAGEFIGKSMDFCRQCKCFNLCGGGCFARWYGLENKNAYEAECAMKRASIKYCQEHRCL